MSLWKHGKRIALASVIRLALFSAAAQAIAEHLAPPQQIAPAQQTAQASSLPSRSEVKLAVECVIDEHDNCTTNATVELSRQLKLRVTNLADWTAQGNSPWKLILFLNGRPFLELHPISTDLGKNDLTFALIRTSDTAASWRDLKSRPDNWKSKGILQDVRPSVGPEGGTAFLTDATCRLVFFTWVGASVCLLFFLLTLAAGLVLSRKTALLRSGAAGPFSLARTQMAIWTWLVVNGYFALAVMTRNPEVNIPLSLLGLLGISTGTTLAAILVDKISAEAQPPRSKGFWKDLTGGDVVGLHRIQLVAWTAVLVFVFVTQIVSRMTIPDFSPTLLGLLGLSATTHVGFKFQENQKSLVQAR